ncbi:MYG1 family protein [Thiomicrorhabdus sp. Milos-T2]|uniref:MYG1 family protein n=1 Tax=Thiomicrorhabdus sp. Milos-T2 TaxID=90814 RepID=UPI000494B0FB|nr:MYG1 family protein [Thiomicrorhabdus sp. Milos-T2]
MLVTHSGRFHADEVFAISMVLMVEDREITRTRDEEIIKQADIVLDVGAEYNPETLRFDHHQNSFTEERTNGIPYATAGLIWRHYAKRIFNLKGLKGDYEVNFATQWVDDKLIADIDAVDNGLYQEDPRPSVSLLIAMMNESSDEPEKQEIAFNKALEFTHDTLENFINAAIKEAEVLVELEEYAKTVENGILVLDKNLPFKDFIRSHPEIKRVVYPRNEEQFGVYCNSQINHLPERFRGLRDSELNEVSGLKDTIFCHKSGFMAVTLSLESALFLANSN